MAALSAAFWCWETVEFFKAIKNLRSPKRTKNPIILLTESIRYLVDTLLAIIKLWKVSLDILATWFLTMMLGASSGGTMGAMIGITMSNVISIFLMFGVNKLNND